ncbi:alginate lyase family protein [Pseudoalteromonas piscicida]|uniref:alginate lyase family protein n=1 Tax=Pseudoalteromonas piscicida TaxID=43662 RepID=UPI0030A13EFB
MLSKFFRLYWTVRYLTVKQVYYRLYYRFKKPVVPFIEDVELFLEGNGVDITLQWNGFSYKEQLIENNEATFLNKRVSINRAQVWNYEGLEKLWLYNLHYFDDLCSSNSIERFVVHKRLVHRWIDENPPCIGNGWEPYTLSLRIVNFIKWSSKLGYKDKRFLASVYQQSEALLQQCEYHILANHLFANGKALIFSGIYFGGLGEKFLQKGLEILDSEFKEQFLEDGAHFELSPMYHSVMLWDVLELIELAQVSNNEKLLKRVEVWKAVAAKALSWLESMIHPDGEISFFNDAAMGIAASPATISKYAQSLNISLKESGTEKYICHMDSGFSVIDRQSLKLLINHADISPSYQPGHAHADSLSFELSLMGKRVFVNSGTSMYGVSKQREAERGTSMHNTVTIDNLNSSEVWSGFRVARRANSYIDVVENTPKKLILDMYHDGYTRLNSKYVHKRVLSVEENCICLSDSIPVSPPESVYAHYHLHPDIIVSALSSSSLLLKHKKNDRIIISLEIINATFTVERYKYHPEFGISIDSNKLVLQCIDTLKPFSVLMKW